MKRVSPFIGAYWSARKESREECAKRTASFLEALHSWPHFRYWYPKTAKRTSGPSPISFQVIGPHLSTNNRDDDGTPILELGLTMEIWNGDNSHPVSLSITCGGYSVRQKNFVVINLPSVANIHEDVITEYGDLLRILVEAWDPDYGVATTMQALAKFAPISADSIEGWFIYRKGGAVVRAPFFCDLETNQ